MHSVKKRYAHTDKSEGVACQKQQNKKGNRWGQNRYEKEMTKDKGISSGVVFKNSHYRAEVEYVEKTKVDTRTGVGLRETLMTNPTSVDLKKN